MRIIEELKRRNVIRIAAAYLVTAWLIIQVVDTLAPEFGLPGGTVRMVTIALTILFLPAMVFTWYFELTPEGFRRDAEVDRESTASKRSARRFDYAISLILVLAVAYFAFDKFLLAPERTADQVEAAREAGRTEGMLGSFGKKSIAVLPFLDMSPGRDQAYLGDGIAEELLTLLGRLDDLRIIPRTSSFALRGTNLSIPEIAERLGVSHVLDGSVRRSGNQVRVSAHLIEANTNSQLWSGTFESELDDVFDIQDRISAHVVLELKLRVVDNAPERVTTEPEAYELYLQGRKELSEFGTEDYDGSIELFERAIEIDPTYAPARGSLAIAYLRGGWPEQVIEEQVARTLELDADNADALAALGGLRSSQGRLDEANELFDRAITAHPKTAYFAYRFAAAVNVNRDPVRYLAYARQAYRVNPLDRTIRYYVGNALTKFGHIDQALEVARSGFEFFPNDSLAYSQAGRIHEIAGNNDLAILSFYHALRAGGGVNPQWAHPGRIPLLFVGLGDAQAAEAWLDETADSFRDENLYRFVKASAALFGGDQARALQMLEEYYEWASQSGAKGWWNRALRQSMLHLGRDFEGVRALYEQSDDRDWKTASFDPALWAATTDYALALLHTGDDERASDLIAQTITFLESQVEIGVELSETFSIHANLAQLHAMNGNLGKAIRELRIAERRGGLGCLPCLRIHAHFDNLRGNPQFEGIVARREAKDAAQLERLREQGMILTPSELMALEEFDFDPFESEASP